MQLREIMTTKTITVGMDDRLGAVKDIFDSMGFHHLLVVGDDKTLCGVLSDRDLLRALSPHLGTTAETTRDSASLSKRVHQIMSHKPITLTSDATVADAIGLFLKHSVSCIPVVNEEFRPVGIVSWRDILRAFVARGIAS
jgi:acetoin utilization protein AcuB